MVEYICPRYPFLHMGKVGFKDGWFRTDDPDLQAQIERDSWYKVFIWRADGGVKDDKESGRGIPAGEPQETGSEPGSSAEERGGSVREGREEGGVFQESELEALVKASGIHENQGRKEK